MLSRLILTIVIYFKEDSCLNKDRNLTIEQICSVLDTFISSSEPSVIVIRGAWGIGKTHFWNNYVSDKASSGACKVVNDYSYVSLFGIDSLSNLKRAIFENKVPVSNIGTPATFEYFSENMTVVSTAFLKKITGKVVETGLLGSYEKAIESASFMTIKNDLICIDDMERKGNTLSTKDVLGLISQLKENRNCKIVILLNDYKMDDDYKDFREKVIDLELTYNPSVEANVNIAFDGDSDLLNICKEYCIALESKNIRTLTKTKRYFETVLTVIISLEEEVQRDIISSIALYCLCFYRSGDESIPTIEYVLKNKYHLFKTKDNSNKNDCEIKWDLFLRKYGYCEIDDIDKVIASGIQSGFIDTEKLSILALSKNYQVKSRNKVQEFMNAWDLFHNSLGDDEDKIIALLKDSITNNVELLGAGDLNSAVELLREIDKSDIANDLIDTFVSEREENLGVFDLERFPFASSITDEKLKSAFMVKNNEIQRKPTLSETIRKVATSTGWSQIDEEVLAESDPSEYVKIFESENGRHLKDYINSLLRFNGWSDSSKSEAERIQRKKIGENVVQALRIIGAKSKINKIRVRRFGINLDDG